MTENITQLLSQLSKQEQKTKNYCFLCSDCFGNGVTPVAIFGSATFDVRQIDPITIKLANASVKLKGNGQPMVSYSDLNSDGFTDITINVITEALQMTENDVKADLEGRLINGEIIKGSDSIRIVP